MLSISLKSCSEQFYISGFAFSSLTLAPINIYSKEIHSKPAFTAKLDLDYNPKELSCVINQGTIVTSCSSSNLYQKF